MHFFRTPRRNERGFTLIELLIVSAMLGIVVLVLVRGNMWVTDAGALRCAQIIDPSVTRLVLIHRKVTAPTEMVVEKSDGTRWIYTLDADILFNAECTRLL